PHPDDPRREREDSRRGREDDHRTREAESRREDDRRTESWDSGLSRGDRTRGPRPAGGQGERRTRGPRPEQARRGLRDEDHGPRLEHERAQADPRRQPRPSKPRLTKPTRPVKAPRPDRPDDVADRAMGTGWAAKSKA